MPLPLKRDRIAGLDPKYNLTSAPKPPARELPKKDPVAAAIDRFSDALKQVTQANADTQATITALVATMASEIRAAQPPRPKSWTFNAKKDTSGNMVIHATPNY